MMEMWQLCKRARGVMPVHSSLDDLIENSSADVVVVSTCNSDHFATASRLLGAGRAVMVEKPVCENPEDLNSLAKSCQASLRYFSTRHLMPRSPVT